jgi:hypothetical protein
MYQPLSQISSQMAEKQFEVIKPMIWLWNKNNDILLADKKNSVLCLCSSLLAKCCLIKMYPTGFMTLF